jgi:ATP-dependent RNA helicase RhlE
LIPNRLDGAAAAIEARSPGDRVPTTFAELPLWPSLHGTLAAQGLTTLTEVQGAALPALLARRGVVAIAETGSGKTLTYALPVLDHLKRLEDAGDPVTQEGQPRAVIVVPTRELGEQVAKVFKGFTHETRLRVRTVLGGQKMKLNKDNVAGIFEVLVATPGRLERLVADGLLRLADVRTVVLDEADQLLDQGFLPQVMDVVRGCPPERCASLFSATMSPAVRTLAERLFADAVTVETTGSQKVVPTLRTRYVDVADGRRADALLKVLGERSEGGTMLFANTRAQCDEVVATLRRAGLVCAVHRGEMDPVERRRNLNAFREKEVAFLVATDVGARGLDIGHVGRVINVHLPNELDTYLHRVGRTARAGKPGLVVNLVTPRDAAFLELLGDGTVAPQVARPGRAARRDPKTFRTRNAP